ncbi:MAG: ion transporter [Hyphomicrobiaceae bacterium]
MTTSAISTFRLTLARFFASRTFEFGIVALILVNALLMAAETVPSIASPLGSFIQFFNDFILLVFVVELLLKIAVFGRAFWANPWNWFDLVVVLISVAPATEAFSALRALRALRLLRLVTVMPSLRRVVEGFIKAIPSLGSIMGLLAMLLFVFTIMGTKLFGEAHPEYFGALGSSAFTLFSVMTLEGWPDLAREVMKTHPMAWTFFISFIVLSSWAVLNLVIGVIVDSMQAHAREQEEELETAILRNQLKLLDEVSALRGELAQLRATLTSRTP